MDKVDNLLNDLNPIQREAVLQTEGPLIVLAGAGSGKTRLLTYKIAYLIHAKNVSPYAILAITFTNKAAAEMKSRVQSLLGGSLAKDMWISTFHSACNRILRVHAPVLGYSHNFAIYDSRDTFQVIRECLKEMDIDPKEYPPSRFRASISSAKNKLVGPGELAKTAADEYEALAADVYKKYEQKMKENDALDFDDLIKLTIKILSENDDILEKYRRKFRYILVDEYQDTNPAQYRLIYLLAHGKNITVVGDEDQSIYAFRMADIRNILGFEKDYPGTNVIKMEQNYRSTKKILEVANYIISHNINRKGKVLWTDNSDGGAIAIFAAANEFDEAAFVVREVERLVADEGEALSDCAVFYRTHDQSRVMEEALLQAGLPYRIIGSLRFYERKEIKDALAYLWVIYNPSGSLQLRRIINVPKRGIGKRTIEQIDLYANRNNLTFYQALGQVDKINLSSRAKGAVLRFIELIEELISLKDKKSLSGLVRAVWKETGYIKELEAEGTLQAKVRCDNLGELISTVRQYETGTAAEDIGAFLQQISLVTPADTSEGKEDGVRLMTLHSAKGLEFSNVFIIGLEEGVFPHSRSLAEKEQLEEERRLCYVGMTRAKKRIYLSYADSRMIYGRRMISAPSRFLSEIPRGYQESAPQAGAARSEGLRQIFPGELVVHDKWGDGLVLEVEGSGENAVATINFSGLGVKRVLLVYTPLKLKREQG